MILEGPLAETQMRRFLKRRGREAEWGEIANRLPSERLVSVVAVPLAHHGV